MAGSWQQVVLVMAVLVTGCTSSATPKCTDEAVQKLVVDITGQSLFKVLLPEQMQQNYRAIIEETEGTPLAKEYSEVDMQGMGYVYGFMPVEYFVRFTEISPTAAKMKADIQRLIDGMRISLDAIRCSEENAAVKKTSCAANLTFANGKTVPITYTAQRTEDKRIWVEVSGL